MIDFIHRVKRRMQRELALQTNRMRVKKLSEAAGVSMDADKNAPVVIFNASTRLSGLSQNAGFSLLTSLALRAEGVPVIQFICDRAQKPCVLGTNRDDPTADPPCAECVRTSRYLFTGSEMQWYQAGSYPQIDEQINELNLQDLVAYSYHNVHLGKMILPSLRWILRRHHLIDDANTQTLARSYIRSAWHVYLTFSKLLETRKPQAVVVFNGMFYPEAMARLAAREQGIPCYSHEVGMLPYSAFFTEKEATAYPVKVDEDFVLDADQNEKLDRTLKNRFQGRFQTAGVTFWPEMKRLDAEISEKIASHQAMVPIFTNVIFDTSQAHANTIFDHMFEWLDLVVPKMKKNPETLFIIRAHPDEVRPGKESRESVLQWFSHKKLSELSNLLFIRADETISSYDLIREAKFVMVYNSTVGLEASIMGKPVLCAGRARYTQIPTVFFPDSRRAYEIRLDTFLSQSEISQPISFVKNARRVLYSQLFRASIPFNQYMEEDEVWKGYVKLKKFDLERLRSDQSDVMHVITRGILKGTPFIRNI